ncbi:adenylate/guanylate cyclase domain-containing protein [Pararhizobium sp. LjRoot238]|uniref:adenylate/guanylate cyclase domain-containing protein n=1 Tax=Pararhizobium sp. LjRoot238 TaxID=3342293 RepID=UPI003ED009F4
MLTATAERRLAAIVAADVAGYSRLMGENEVETLAALKVLRKDLIDPLVAGHKGHIVKTTGDGLLLEFPSVVEAVACAVDVQRGMLESNRRVLADRRIDFRMGINIGDVIFEDGDVFGDGVNVAARLEQIAPPGGICLSEDVYRQVRNKLDVAVYDVGQQRLKNIANPVRVYRIDLTPQAKARRRFAEHADWRARPLGLALAGAAMLSAIVTAAVWFGLGRIPAPQQQAERSALEAATLFPIIAVLPFANQTGDEAQSYFADGVTEEVINALGRFKSLRVIGPNAVLRYRNQLAARVEISSELGASYLVDGSVRRSADRVRISAQLSEAKSGTVMWSDRYDGELSDIFAFQDRIARDIAGTLAANITQLEGRRRLDEGRPDQTAFDLVLRARAIGHGSSRAANRQVRELMTKAVELDPNYATSHALLAEAIYSQVVQGWTEFPDRELARAEDLARRAIALGPDEPDGHRILGRILLIRAEYEPARNALQRAIDLNPSDANALAVWGALQSFIGDLPRAIESLELALKYDPLLQPNAHFDLAISYYLARRHEDALRVVERGISRFPNFVMFNVPAAAAAAQLGRQEQAAFYVTEIRRRLPQLNVDLLGSRFRDPAHPAYMREGLRRAGL